MASVCMKCGLPHPIYVDCEKYAKSLDSGRAKKKPDSSAQKRPIIDDKPEPVPIPTEPPKTPEKGPKVRQSYDLNAAERARRWRENNPEKHREYMREYMRKRRQGL